MRASSAYSLFDTESVWAILMRIAPPVMLAQLIQAMYNIVDSYFVGQFSSDGLTALSIVYPVQLIVTAIAVGTGVGVNTPDVPVRRPGEPPPSRPDRRNRDGPGADQLADLRRIERPADAPPLPRSPRSPPPWRTLP